LCLGGLSFPPTATAALPRVNPTDVAMDTDRLARIDGVVAEGLKNRNMPGCVVLIGRRGGVVFCKAYGDRAVEPQRESMTVDTVFDLASVTKPVATATSVMLLIERGQLRLTDKVSQHIPEFAANDKQNVTVLHLLTHQSGLIADNSIKDYADGPEKSFENIWQLKLTAEPGAKFIYSDVGFLVLGELVKKITGQSVHEFSRDNIFVPLGMTETGYLPAEPLRQRAAPTQQLDGQQPRGDVHDPRAFKLGGVAGHAGLFGTADDLAVFAQMMLNRGRFGGKQILGPATVDLMTRPVAVPGGSRCLGWDHRTGYSINRGETMSSRAFGHGGFTGTGLWIDPHLDLFVVFLSNRVHPNGKGLVNPLIGRIGTIAAAAVLDAPPELVPLSPVGERAGVRGPGIAETPTSQKNPLKPPPSNSSVATAPPPHPNPLPQGGEGTARVLTGIDVLRRDNFAALAGRKVGLITNHTGVAKDRTPTFKLLHAASGVKLVALFSPEHGAFGKLDQAKIADAREPDTGLPIFSLYGETRSPTAEMLRGIDTLVFDIQDIGTRFYTYVSTMGLAMQAAAKHNVKFVVLDRPNPIGGVAVEGPVLDAGKESFVGFHRIPVRHGMTVGELAKLFQADLKLDLELTVIRCDGWKRSDYFDATGLTWINPSPNMRSLTEAVLYPGVGLWETTNISVGRGTDTPFELIGAPWMQADVLVRELTAAELPGVRFESIERFQPSSSKWAGTHCKGVRFVVTNRDEFQPVRLGLAIATVLHKHFAAHWDTKTLDRLLGHDGVRDAILSGKSVAEIEATFASDLREFQKRRRMFLLYE
jgi:uncharacterized protein YbbC (DUF1343 family)/CubicO group peptidase (beta-lactamase class C family)